MFDVGCSMFSLSHNSSARCGAKGASKTKKSRKTETGFVSHVIASFTKTFIHEQPPDAAEKTIDALNAPGVPRLHHFERAHEHFVKAEGVGAELFENVV